MKYVLFFVSLFFFSEIAFTQTIYWNAKPSNNHPNLDSLYDGDFTLLKTAEDLASLLNKATGGNTYTYQFYSDTLPTSGVILNIDTLWETTKPVQYCTVVGDGTNTITFRASSSYGIRFGVYSFLAELGFKFYGPSELWHITPSISGPFQLINKSYQSTREVHGWFGSGGSGPVPYFDSLGTIVLDKWDLYQTRNNMLNEYGNLGSHVGEAWVTENADFLASNPCWLAEYNGTHQAIPGAMPSIYNDSAMMDYANFAARAQTIIPNIKKDVAQRSRISVEAADGTLWGNTATSCGVSSWPSGSEQQFTIANFCTQHLKSTVPFPFKTVCYAYGEHPDPPSFNIDQDIQIGVANGYQTNVTPIGQLHRWKNKHIVSGNPAIFEYEYLDVFSTGPYTSKKYMADQAKRINTWNTLGIQHESTFSIFSACLYLYPFHKSLMDGSDFNTNFDEMISDLFPGSKSAVKELYDFWGDENSFLTGNLVYENFVRFPKVFSLIKQMDGLATEVEEIQRIRLLKAYMHFLVLQTDVKNTINPLHIDSLANNLSNYLVSIYHTEVINSYQTITLTLSLDGVKQSTIDDWATQYKDSITGDVIGFTYNPKHFFDNPPITDAQIDANFIDDLNKYPSFCKYNFVKPQEIVNEACLAGLVPKDTIFITISGKNSNSIGYNIISSGASTIRFRFNKYSGYANHKAQITLDSQDGLYSTSTSIDSTQSGIVDLAIPKAGEYLLAILYKDSLEMDIEIIPNSNYIYKNAPVYPFDFERYRDSLSAPRYIFVPKNIDTLFFKLYFTFNDLPTASRYVFTSPSGIKPTVGLSTTDSSLYYIPVDSTDSDKFWQLYVDSTLYPVFYIANTQNVELYLQPGACNVSVNEIKNLINFSIFPNPNNGVFTLSSKLEGKASVSVYNNMGQKCYQRNYDKINSSENIDLSILTTGIYFVRVENNNSFSTKKLIISK